MIDLAPAVMCFPNPHFAIQKSTTTTTTTTKSLQSCSTLCDPMDLSPPGSSVHGILQARTLEWGTIAFSQKLGKEPFKNLTPGSLKRPNIWLWTVINHFPDLFSAPAFDKVHCFWVLLFPTNWDNLFPCFTVVECITVYQPVVNFKFHTGRRTWVLLYFQ